MSPMQPLNDLANAAYVDVVFCCEDRINHAGCGQLSYLKHLLLRKLGRSAMLSFSDKMGISFRPMRISSCNRFWTSNATVPFARAASIFRNHISRIFCFSTEKQMRRINARGIIASVKTAKADDLLSGGYKERNMCRHEYAMLDIYLSISIAIFARLPFPAFILPFYVNLFPKVDLVIFRKIRDYFCSHIASLVRCVISVCRKLNTTGERAYFPTFQYISQAF